MGIFVVVFLSIPVYSFVDNFSNSQIDTRLDSLVTKIEMDIAFSCSEALMCLKEQKIVYNKHESLYGFEFVENLFLRINHYGQIEMGDSAVLEGNGERFMIKVRPVSGSVTIERIKGKNEK